MTLTAGTRLGPYEILAALGAGGMGEVYRARDTKLCRDVAIKVLPDHLADDKDRIARFEREAKSLAALSHPHIATLYGLEESDGRHLLVMELVEGETLGERLQRGPLQVEEVLRTAIQIADALEAAHEKAIVHRDLKPANIKLTPDAKVKVLDFGLAKALEVESVVTDVTHSPTLSMMATQAGVILGTAAYMSPEQAKGLAADHRSDVFSFGVVLYEMLTGRPPFQGETAPDILASVLARDPDTTDFPPRVNPRLPELVRRCLEKNPKRRWQAIGDVRAELETISVAPRDVGARPQPALAQWKRTAPIVSAALIVGVLTGFAVWGRRPAPPAPIARFSLTLPEGQLFTNAGRHLLAISPDGRQIVYVANRQLFLRHLSELDATPIKGTEPSERLGQASAQGVNSPVFSPDGQFVAYYVLGERAIKKVNIVGGTPTTLCAAINPFGMSWGPSGIVFGQGPDGVMRVAPDGGQPNLLVGMKAGDLAHDPQLLPGDKSLLFTVTDNAGKSRIVLQSLTSAERKTLVEDAWDGRYLSTGHVAFIREGVVFAAPFDARREAITAEAVPVVEGVRRTTANDNVEGQFAVSSTGSLVYVPGPTSVSLTQRRLMLLDKKGARQTLDVPLAAYASPRISPDGKWLAVETDDGNDASIWVYNLSGTSSIRRLTLIGRNRFPTWTSDSSRITFQSDREGDAGIFWQGLDDGTAERLTKSEPRVSHIPETWAPDGNTLLFALAREGVFSLYSHSRADHQNKPFGGVQNTYMPGAVFSPDGQWVAYYSRPPGSASGSLMVQSASSAGTKHEVHKGGGIHPFWSHGQPLQLFYRLPTRMESVEVTTRPTFGFSKPVEIPWQRLMNDDPTVARKMDALPDGEHFIAVDQPGQSESGVVTGETIQVVLNWLEELKARVPSR